MDNNIAIKAENISKYYRLGQINSGMFFKDMQTRFALMMGREDPNGRIGANGYSESGDGFYALRDINFEIEKGDRVGIIGRNGAGKSTLLKVISEITAPTSGRIGINGRVASLLEVGTGFNPEMTGRENVYLNGAILGMKRSEINAKMKDIIEFSEIEEHIDTPVKRYSSGMYVRLAFAVAANLDSEILIADEVLAVGDAKFQEKAIGKMSDISTGQGRTVLFVSHQMNAVKALCKSGIVIDHGTMQMQGDIDSCISYYQKDLFNTESIEDLAHYNNEYFDLLGFDIVDGDGKHIEGPIANNQEAYVQIDYNLKTKHSALTIGYAVFDKEGTLIYWTYNVDRFDKYVEPHLGENVVRAEIPNHLLNEDDYSVCMMSSIHFQEWIIDPQRSAPRRNFHIQGGLSESPFWTMKRPGICAPLIAWKTIS